MSKRNEILEAITRIEALPANAGRLAALLAHTDADLNEITRCVELDPGLAANVLHVCNSALYVGRANVASIRDAVVRLGTRMVMNLALAHAIRPLAGNAVPGYGLPAGELWRHSVAVATGTEILSEGLGFTPPPEAFTAGLLHDVGKLVLGIAVADESRDIQALVAGGGITFEEAERKVLGIDHAESGALLLEQWGLPESLCLVARWHHEPDSSPVVSRVLDLVHVTDILVLGAGYGMGEDGYHYRVSESVVERLALSNDLMERTLCKILDGMAAIGVETSAP